MKFSMANPLEKLKIQFPNMLFQKHAATPVATRMLGLNIGKSKMVAAELVHESDQITLDQYAVQAITDRPIQEQVKQFMEQNKFQAKKVNISLKGQGVVIRFLSFPRMNKADFESAIQFEAEKYLPFNLADVMVDFYINEDGKTAKGATMPVILVAARKTEVSKLMKIIEPTGLQINAIDIDAFAC